jgi:hypothetical protein
MSHSAMNRVARGTLVEIFSIENRWVRLSEICNHIIAKVDSHGAGCLTSVERTIDRVNDFEYRMIQGGLSGLLYADWLDWDAIREVASALETVGARDAARLLNDMVEHVIAALERQPVLGMRDDLGWGDLLAQVDPTRTLDRIERELGPYVDGLNRYLLEYVEAHQVDLLRADEGGGRR